MIIALTNDDSYSADGIQLLVEVLQEVPDVKVYLIAPKHHMSAKGTSLSISQSISFERYSKDGVTGYVIDGTPCDSVIIGLSLLENDGVNPDLVVSGINAGANCGLDAHYSGTLGAAKQAVLQGIPAVAMSNLQFRETLVEMRARIGPTVRQIITTLDMQEMRRMCTARQILNINFPEKEILGFRWCQFSDALLFHVHPQVNLDVQSATYCRYHRSEEQETQGDDYHALTEGFVALSVYSMAQPLSAAVTQVFQVK